MGHFSGGLVRAHRYPQTLQRYTGNGRVPACIEDVVPFILSETGGRLSGTTGAGSIFSAIVAET